MVVGDAFIQGTSLPARVTQKEPDDCSSIGSFSEVKEGSGRTYSLAYVAPAQPMIITIVIFYLIIIPWKIDIAKIQSCLA